MYEHTKKGGNQRTFRVGKRERRTSKYEWIKRDTGSSVMQALHSKHERNKYLLNEILPPRSPSPGRISAHQNAISKHCTRLAHPAHRRAPQQTEREMVILLCKDKKQNQFIWATHHLTNCANQTTKVSLKVTKPFQACAWVKLSTNIEKTKMPITKD